MPDFAASETVSRRSLLLIEDNRDDEALALRALTKHGFNYPVHVAHDGVEALDYLFGRGAFAGRDLTELPSVVLLDLKLPRVDGLEVLRGIRGEPRTRHLPVVVLTSSREEQDLVQSYGLGANSYVRKPVDYEKFSEAVRRVGVYWLLLNEEAPRAEMTNDE